MKSAKSMSLRAAAFVGLAGLAFASPAAAVTVTIDEAALDAVFAQEAFGAAPVDVRVAPVRSMRAPRLARVADPSDEAALFGLARAMSPAIGLVFVESIDWCTGYDTEIVGCALRDAPGLFVEADFAAGPYGVEMIAHEIAHNLGLRHRTGGLMDPMLNGDMTLTSGEAMTVLASALVGSDASGRFIDIAPVRIAPIPLPASAPLLVLGALALVFARRRA